MNKFLLNQVSGYVKEKLHDETTGHDWFHAERVRKNAVKIAKTEKHVDLFIIQAAALMHDLGDWKINKSKKSEEEIIRNACKILKIPHDESEKIVSIIINMSFSANISSKKALTLEGKIVQDADRLDAMGAIGIARVFAYGGKRGNQIYNPNVKLKKNKSTQEYKYGKNTSVNHFYEKIFLLKGLMNTKKGKQMAQIREKFMKKYLEEFYKEWNNKI